MTTLPEFLLARYAEIEAWANGCEGLHWVWADNATDTTITPDPLLMEYLDDSEGRALSLRSVEQFPYQSIPGEGPRFLIHTAEEVKSTVGGHIVRNDPAYVLADVQAKRQIVEWHTERREGLDGDWGDGDCCEQRLGPVEFVPISVSDASQAFGVDPSGNPVMTATVATQAYYGCVTLMMLALPHADHPDYREEWKP